MAGRQSEEQHRTVLIGFAAAVELALTWMVADPSLSAERSGVPAQWELDHHLDADVLIGAVCLDSLPSLTSVEQVALVAVGAIARTAPAAWRSDYRQLIPLGEAIHAAVALARPGR